MYPSILNPPFKDNAAHRTVGPIYGIFQLVGEEEEDSATTNVAQANTQTA